MDIMWPGSLDRAKFLWEEESVTDWDDVDTDNAGVMKVVYNSTTDQYRLYAYESTQEKWGAVQILV